MRLHAVIFDVYHTLFEIGPPPGDAAQRWESLWEDKLCDPPRLTLEEFAVEYEKIIAREHAAAIQAGVSNPEVYWPEVAKEALPELARLEITERDEFLYQHAKLQRTVRLTPEAAETLSELARRKLLLGLVSNCQPYTLREMDCALSAADLGRAIFKPELCVFSFSLGFSKPNPHLFRVVRAQMAACGVSAAQTLVVGDRPVNDLEPARTQGFQTWLLAATPSADARAGGDWILLRRHLATTIGS